MECFRSGDIDQWAEEEEQLFRIKQNSTSKKRRESFSDSASNVINEQSKPPSGSDYSNSFVPDL